MPIFPQVLFSFLGTKIYAKHRLFFSPVDLSARLNGEKCLERDVFFLHSAKKIVRGAVKGLFRKAESFPMHSKTESGFYIFVNFNSIPWTTVDRGHERSREIGANGDEA